MTTWTGFIHWVSLETSFTGTGLALEPVVMALGPVSTCTDKDSGYRGRKKSRCMDYWVGPASACLVFGPVLGCSRNLAL